MNRGIERIKRKFEEDPITVILVGAFALTAAAKVIDALSSAQSRNAYAKHAELRRLGR